MTSTKTPEGVEPPKTEPRTRRPWLALIVLVAIFSVLELSGASRWLELARLREWVAVAGPWGPALFVLVFVMGVVLQVPGMVFVLAAPALFPAPAAVAVVLVGGNLGVNAGFVVVRALGGQSLQFNKGPAILRRAFAQLESHPIRSVAIIRFAVLILPPVTGALALTKLSLRDHAVGTGLAITPVFAIIVGIEALVLR